MRIRVQLFIAVLVAAMCSAVVMPNAAVAAPGDENWSDNFWLAGFNQDVWALAADGTGNLFATGAFTAIDGVTYGHTAQWNGAEWLPMGNGGLGPGVAIAANDQGEVFTAQADGSIDRWDGTSWTEIRVTDGQPINKIVIDSSGAPVVGVFDWESFGSGVERWDGSEWVALGGLVAIDNDYFYELPPITADAEGNVFRGTSTGVQGWDGTAWQPVGVDGAGSLPVYQLQAGADGSLVAVTLPFNTQTYFLDTWMWDGTTWIEMGPAVIGNDSITALGVSPSGSIVAAGRDVVAELTDQSWTPLALITGGYISSLAPYGDDIVVAGNFVSAGGLDVTGIGSWNADDGWKSMHGSVDGDGIADGVRHGVILADGDLVVGGRFSKAGSTKASNVARWDGSTWNAMGPGLPFTVESLALLDDTIVALSRGTLFRWSEESQIWAEVTTDHQVSIYQMFTDESGGVLAAGYFYNGSIEHEGLARLDGSTWTLLGSPLYVMDVVIDRDGNIIASGYLSESNDGANSVATWDGSAWVPLGDGPHGTVDHLTVTSQGVVAAGQFGLPGQAESTLVLWDGTQWSSLNAPLDLYIAALTASPCGGVLATAFTYDPSTGSQTSSVVRWDGNAWDHYGSGLGNAVPRVLLAKGRDVYALGDEVYTAGGNSSMGVAHWTEPGAAPISEANSMAEILASCNYDPDIHGDVLRLYRAFFDREPDVTGARYWIDVNSKGQTLDQIADHFTLSQEYENNYAGTTNEQYLAAAYTNVLGRDYDQEGFDYWLGLLNSGELTRGGVVRWIAANAELLTLIPIVSHQPISELDEAATEVLLERP